MVNAMWLPIPCHLGFPLASASMSHLPRDDANQFFLQMHRPSGRVIKDSQCTHVKRLLWHDEYLQVWMFRCACDLSSKLSEPRQSFAPVLVDSGGTFRPWSSRF